MSEFKELRNPRLLQAIATTLHGEVVCNKDGSKEINIPWYSDWYKEVPGYPEPVIMMIGEPDAEGNDIFFNLPSINSSLPDGNI